MVLFDTVAAMSGTDRAFATYPVTSLPVLEGENLWRAQGYLDLAAVEAVEATCLRSKCGSVVVGGGRVLGRGSNSLPGGVAPTSCRKEDGSLAAGFKSDRTCCVHAEVRAIMGAVTSGEDVRDATLFFTRVDAEGARVPSGAPYCTICSKFALDAGVAFFVLEHDYGVVLYPTWLYNEVSFAYGQV